MKIKIPFRSEIRLGVDPPPLALSASVDDVLDAFYEDFATSESGRYWWWAQMVLLEPNEIIVNNGENDLYRMAFTITDNGAGNAPTVEFGPPVDVRLEPIDSTIADDDAVAAKSEAVAAAVTGISAARGQGKVAASFKSREESRPKAKEGDHVREHIEKLRAKLGLKADATDEEVLAAAEEAVPAEAPVVDPPEPAEPTAPAVEPEVEPVKPELKSVQVEAGAFELMKQDAAAGRTALSRLNTADDERWLDTEVLAKGRVPARSRDSYLKQLAADRKLGTNDTREFLLELAENVVPVQLRGVGDDGETRTTAGGGHPQLGAFMERHMPDIAARKAQLGTGQRNRVMSDQ